jgi:hypothetical protein
MDLNRNLALEEIPAPPLWRLVDREGGEVHAGTEVGGERATVAALFEDEEIAREFSEEAGGYGLEALAGRERRKLGDWGSVEAFASAGADYVLVVSRRGSGLFHAGDVARAASERGSEGAEGWSFPLYVISDEAGEAPLVTVESGGEEVIVAPLFGSPEGARAFREGATHLRLPGWVGRIEDRDGLRRHALVAREAGAGYAVLDPGAGYVEAIPLEDLIR